MTGNIRVRSGATFGYILTSDANGVASWQAPGVSVFTWNITGNTGTTATTHFIGTNDSNDFVMKTNGIERMRILSGGNIGIGTSSPTSAFEIAGQMKITG